MQVYHMLPWEIMRLTDRQVHELYYHPRDEYDQIRPVEPPDGREPNTLAQALFQYECLANKLRMKKEDIEANKEKLRRKWAPKGEDGDGNTAAAATN